MAQSRVQAMGSDVFRGSISSPNRRPIYLPVGIVIAQVIATMRAIKGLFLIGVLTALAASPTAKASVTIDIYQVGPGVQIVGTGSMNLASAPTFSTTGSPQFNAIINPNIGVFPQIYDAYAITNVIVTGAAPTANPYNPDIMVDSTKGVFVNLGYLYVPQGYVSNTSLSFTASILNYVLTDYGFGDGDFMNVTWTIGGNSESLQMNFHAVPEPSSMALLGLAALGGCLLLRKKA